jgi:glycosyltransferase involved in cell wall biosynthesis
MLAIIGRLTRLKGHHDFLTMMSRLRERSVDAAGAIVGGEDPRRRRYARELRERVARERLGDRVVLTGERRDVREIAAEARIVLALSTKPESFGRATLEALRLGTPVLGYDHGGVGEILSAVYPEGAVPLGDVGELTDRAAKLIAAPKRLAAPTGRFTKREMLERTLALYEELAGEELAGEEPAPDARA